MTAMISGNFELVDLLMVEEKFRKICVKKQNEYISFKSEIDELRKKTWQNQRKDYPKDKIEELKKTWANAANVHMKKELNDFFKKRPDLRSRSFCVKFENNILKNDEVLLCFTEKVTELLNPNQKFNQSKTENMYVRFNNIFETKTKLNKLLNQNNSRQKTDLSSNDIFSRLLQQANSQGHAAQFPNSNINNNNSNHFYPAVQRHAAQIPNSNINNNNSNHFYPAVHGVRYSKN